ncbi:MAG: hypothetical protein AAF402_04290 [Pseudomonadota bacterium]
MLLSVPAIIAGTAQDPVFAQEKITELAGSWRFIFDTFDNEFRFYRNSAQQIIPNDPGGYSIDGEVFVLDFSFVIDTPLIGIYSAPDRLYLVTEIWGPPDFDGASYYFFDEASRNSAGDCHFYGDTRGNIADFYVGFGGSIPCDPLTKVLVSNIGKSLDKVNASADKVADAAIAAKREQMHRYRELDAEKSTSSQAHNEVDVSKLQLLLSILKQNLPGN